MVNVAIVGASGYTGGELLRILLNHPEVEVTDVSSRKYDGTPIEKVHPHLRDTGLVFKNIKPSDALRPSHRGGTDKGRHIGGARRPPGRQEVNLRNDPRP